MLAEHGCQRPFTSLYLAFRLAAWHARTMWRFVLGLGKISIALPLMLLLAGLTQSSGGPLGWPQVPREVKIEAKRFDPAGLKLQDPFDFVAAWRLRSADRSFGGLSALVHTGDGLLAVSDAGALVRLPFGRVSARISSLPAGCGGGVIKRTRDSEAMAIDPQGALTVAFERRNALCRIAPDGTIVLSHPEAMRNLSANSGIESLVSLRNGELLAIGERSPGLAGESPVLKFSPGGVVRLRYQPPGGFRPTDAVQLPGGGLLVVNRKFVPPLSFPGRLTLVDSFDGTTMRGRDVARFDPPNMDRNFEGVAVSRARGRTFVWLISDDNFMPVQDTILVLLEYRPRSR